MHHILEVAFVFSVVGFMAVQWWQNARFAARLDRLERPQSERDRPRR